MSEFGPQVRQMSIKVTAMPFRDWTDRSQKDWESDSLAFAVYMVLDPTGKNNPHEFIEFGHAFRLPRERLDQILRHGDLVEHHKPLPILDEGYEIPIEELFHE